MSLNQIKGVLTTMVPQQPPSKEPVAAQLDIVESIAARLGLNDALEQIRAGRKAIDPAQ